MPMLNISIATKQRLQLHSHPTFITNASHMLCLLPLCDSVQCRYFERAYLAPCYESLWFHTQARR